MVIFPKEIYNDLLYYTLSISQGVDKYFRVFLKRKIGVLNG